MASLMSAPLCGECTICTELLKAPRVLNCQHIFCLDCLERLETKKQIKCPMCKEVTDIPPGLQVKHLPRHKVRSHTAVSRSVLSLVKHLEVGHAISSIVCDENSQIIYTGTFDEQKPIKMYNFLLKYMGHLSSERSLKAASVTIDTKRGLVLAARSDYITRFDRESMEVASLSHSKFKDIEDIVYQPHSDLYIVGDTQDNCLIYIDPKSNKVVRTVETEEARIRVGNIMNLYMAASKTSDNTTLATLDCEKGLVNLYDGDGRYIKTYGGTGSGYGQFNRPDGICMDHQGRVVVSDLLNRRLIRVSPAAVEPHKEWQVLGSTKQYGLGSPRGIDITEDGLAAMAFYGDPQNGPYNLAMVSGFQ